ncbi:hypothetical protein ACFQ3Z_07740 [Streptomyces nogalater]
MLTLQDKLGMDLWVARSPQSLTVRFRQPCADIVRKYSLSCETVYEDNEQRTYVHLYAVPHLTRELVDELVRDLRQPGAFTNAGALEGRPGPG